VERAVADHHAAVTDLERHRAVLERIAVQAIADARAAVETARAAHRRRLTDLDVQENRLLDFIGDPEWPQEKLRMRMRGIQHAKRQISDQLADTGDDMQVVIDVVAAMALLTGPRTLYDRATDEGRRILNQAIFGRLYLNVTDPRHRPA
jgi:hypothetical protein